jgi:carbon storage regulator
MLVLSRKRSESLLIGDGVRITVIKVERNQVRLGIEAPGHVGILRAELLDVPQDVGTTTEAGRPTLATVAEE